MEKAGAIRLVVGKDFRRENHFGQPLIGWLPISQGFGDAIRRGFAAIRVIIQKNINGKLVDIYDQYVIVENPGSIVVCRMGDRIGLVENFRMVGDRIVVSVPTDYIKELDQAELWEDLFASLGNAQWETPRGIVPANDASNLNDIVLRAARIEAADEAGFHIANARIAGHFNWNPTFCVHPQYVVVADIESQGRQNIEDREIIGGTRFFTAAEIRQMADDQILTDGLTLGALALAGFHF